jgi:hypothetical protein
MKDASYFRRLLAESYWRDYEKMVELEETCPDKASLRRCRKGQLHYKTLALIFQDRSQKLK